MANPNPTHFKALHGGFSVGDKFYKPGEIVPVNEISDYLDGLYSSGAIAIATPEEIAGFQKTNMKQADAPKPTK